MGVPSDNFDVEIEPSHGGGDGAIFVLIVIVVSALALLSASWGSLLRVQ